MKKCILLAAFLTFLVLQGCEDCDSEPSPEGQKITGSRRKQLAEHSRIATKKEMVSKRKDLAEAPVLILEPVKTSPFQTLEKDVLDDGVSSLWIKGDNINYLVSKKQAWEKTFPNKRIVAMTIITGGVFEKAPRHSDCEGSYRSSPSGLLIHYESEKK